MRIFALTSLLVLTQFSLTACGRGSNTRSALKEIASTANDTLIAELENGEEKPMRDVLANKEMYGLSDREVELLIENFGEERLNQLVLDYIDPNGLKGQVQARWAYIPQVSDSDDSLRRIESVAKEGQIDIIDGTRSPELVRFPLITLGYPEKFQGAASSTVANFRLMDVPAATESSIMIDSLRFQNVQEPWIKGAAELYMVVSYVDKEGMGASELIELPAVNTAHVDYELRQLVFMWSASRYQIANIAFFEHDSGQNFSGLAQAFASAAAAVATTVIDPTQTTAVAVAGIVSNLAAAIINALPPSAFTDEDDFVDQINTIEKGFQGRRSGVSDNAQVQLRNFEVRQNNL